MGNARARNAADAPRVRLTVAGSAQICKLTRTTAAFALPLAPLGRSAWEDTARRLEEVERSRDALTTQLTVKLMGSIVTVIAARAKLRMAVFIRLVTDLPGPAFANSKLTFLSVVQVVRTNFPAGG